MLVDTDKRNTLKAKKKDNQIPVLGIPNNSWKNSKGVEKKKEEKPWFKIIDTRKIDTRNINLITGIFLLILAASSNFISEALGCKVQKLLKENMYAKNIIIILIIYFSLGFTSKDNLISPYQTMVTSLSIWIVFLIFNRMTLLFTIISLIILASLLVLKNYIDYFDAQDKKEKENKNKDKIEKLLHYAKILFLINLLVIIVGFIIYFRKQYIDHYNDFSFITFIFGKLHCKSINY